MSKRWVEILNAKNQHGYVSIIFVESFESDRNYFEAKFPGLVFVSEGNIIKFESSLEDIYLVDHKTATDVFDLNLKMDEEIDYLKNRCYRSDFNQFYLKSWPTDKSVIIGELNPVHAYEGYMEVYEKNVSLLGVMPEHAFFKEHHYGYTGGAHGWEYSKFHVFSLNDLSKVDFLDSIDSKKILDLEFEKWSKELISKGTYFGDQDNKENIFREVELTMTYPSYNGHRFIYNYQITSDSSYASSDSGWGDYTVSTIIQTDKAYGKYNTTLRRPRFVNNFLTAYFGSLTFFGWTMSLLEVEKIERLLGRELNELISRPNDSV